MIRGKFVTKNLHEPTSCGCDLIPKAESARRNLFSSAFGILLMTGILASVNSNEASATTTTLDCSGIGSDNVTADSTLIQNAIDAASAGDTIIINPGTCKISRALTINKALTLQGAKVGVSPGTTGWSDGQTKLERFQNPQYGQTTFVVVISASNVTVSGFEFSSSDITKNGYNFIDLEGVISDITISYNYIHSSKLWGGIILGNTSGTFTNVTIDNNLIVATGTKDNSPASGLIRFGSKVSPNLKVINNVFQQAPIGGLVLFGWGATKDLEFTGNIVKSGLVNVANVGDASSTPASSGTLSNNVFEGGAFGTTYGDGIYTIIQGTSDNPAKISGNSFVNGAGLKIGSTSTEDPVPTFFSKNVVISNNALTGTGSISIGYHQDASTINVNNNSILYSGDSKALVNNNPDQTLDATNNYWGTTIESEIAAIISGNVTYTPYEGYASVEADPVSTGTDQSQEFTHLKNPIFLTFDNVTAPGVTTVATVSSSDPSYVPPVNFTLGVPPVYLNIKTTATFDGSIAVCVDYDPSSFPTGVEPSLWHNESGTWEDVTASVDTTNHIVCGNVTSLSPFALGFTPAGVNVEGFSEPINSEVINVIKAGKTVPLKFRLGTISITGLNVNITSTPVRCVTFDEPADDVEEYASGNSGLKDHDNGYYQLNWKTPASYANTCRELTLTPTAFGYTFTPATLKAKFQFKR